MNRQRLLSIGYCATKAAARGFSTGLVVLVLGAHAVQAAEPPPAPCAAGLVDRGLIHRAALQRVADVKAGNVRITFVGHSTFAIETPQGVLALTDFNGFQRTPRVPDMVTMNNSHSTHFTDVVDPAIKHVLRGWDPAGGIARHHVTERDLRVYSVPTNIFGTRNGNSVFVFEASGVCLAHLGHLHHFLNDDQVRQLGHIDVLFVPIDGSVTLSHEEAFHVIGQIEPRLIIPMHYGFGGSGFPAAAAEHYPVKRSDKPTIEISRADLPAETEVLFLAGY